MKNNTRDRQETTQTGLTEQTWTYIVNKVPNVFRVCRPRFVLVLWCGHEGGDDVVPEHIRSVVQAPVQHTQVIVLGNKKKQKHQSASHAPMSEEARLNSSVFVVVFRRFLYFLNFLMHVRKLLQG